MPISLRLTRTPSPRSPRVAPQHQHQHTNRDRHTNHEKRHTNSTTTDTPTQSPTHWSSPLTFKPTHQQRIDATMLLWHSEAIAEVAKQLHRQFKRVIHLRPHGDGYGVYDWGVSRRRHDNNDGLSKTLFAASEMATAIGVGYEVVRSRFSSFVFWRCFANGKPLTINNQQSNVVWGVIGWGSGKRRYLMQQSTGIVVKKSNKLKIIIC